MGAKRTSFFTLNWSLIIIIITWFSVFCVSVKHHPLVQFWKALVHFFCRRSEAWLNGMRLMPWVTKRIWSDSGKSYRIELTYGKNTTTSYQKIHFGNSAWLNAHLLPSKRMNFILRSCLIQKDHFFYYQKIHVKIAVSTEFQTKLFRLKICICLYFYSSLIGIMSHETMYRRYNIGYRSFWTRLFPL